MRIVTPKYITREDVEGAVTHILNSVLGAGSFFRPLLKSLHYHVVVLVPAMENARDDDYPDWPNYPLQPFCIYERGFGKEEGWEHPYDDIAKCKALQLWTGRNEGGTTPIPHLLFPGDTPYWGGVKRSGLVVACSGFQPWFDRMISGMIIDAIIALAHRAYENDEKRKAADFVD